MDYFRDKLLSYPTQREISTLLHIYTETAKPKLLIPVTKTQSYVDDVLNQYSVKMYTYPDLAGPDLKLAYNLYSQKSQGGNVFQFDEFKRKPLKKKISKKSVAPSLPVEQKTCPCCEARAGSKHKCEHTLCEKPCSRLKRQKSHQGTGQSGGTQWKKQADDEQEFTPERSELENLQSKSSNVDHQSDFQQEMDMMAQFSDSESFLSNVEKNKRGKGRGGRTRKDGKNQRSRRSNNRRPATREVSVKQEQKVNENGEKIEEKTQLNPLRQNEQGKKDNQTVKQVPTRRRKLIKKSQKKISHSSSNNPESEFEPSSAHQKQLKRRNPLLKRASIENSQKEVPAGQNQNQNQTPHQFQCIKFKKKVSLYSFCTAEELRQNQIFNVLIHQPGQDGGEVKKLPRDKDGSKVEKGKEKERPAEKSRRSPNHKSKQKKQEEPEVVNPEPYPFIQEEQPNRLKLIEMQAAENAEPVVNANLEPVSDNDDDDDDGEEKDELFKQKKNDQIQN